MREPAASSLILVLLRVPRKPARLRGEIAERLRRWDAVPLADGVYRVSDRRGARAAMRALIDEIGRGGGRAFLGRGSVLDAADAP